VTRREALLAAAGAALLRAPAAHAQDPDLAMVQRLLARERGAARAYGRATALPAAAQLAAQDAQHARVLATHVEAFGTQAPPPPRALDPLAARLAAASDRAAARQAALALEADLIYAYEEALKMLVEPNTAMVVARVLASHGQQRVLLAAG
jgi:hypothetical protein